MKNCFTDRQTGFITHAISVHLDAARNGHGSLWWGNSDEEDENSATVEGMLGDGWTISEMANEDSSALNYIDFAVSEYESLRDDGLSCSTYTKRADETRIADAIREKISQFQNEQRGE